MFAWKVGGEINNVKLNSSLKRHISILNVLLCHAKEEMCDNKHSVVA